ncbi:hypothetical protein BBP40_000372 [Aspergillus hancockii]|nr:hypothetical protein BBP40_000372 [Aspergillus hancockii]
MKIDYHNSKVSAGFNGMGSTQVNRKETRDLKGRFSMRYEPKIDPTFPNCKVSPDLEDGACDDGDYIWEGTSHLPRFRELSLSFWQSRLALARKLVRIFALALGEQEDYIGDVATRPGADALYIHYPGIPDVTSDTEVDVGIGSHTDIQCFTVLWQDDSNGLQVLSAQDEWLDARPMEGTLVDGVPLTSAVAQSEAGTLSGGKWATLNSTGQLSLLKPKHT